MDYRSSEETKLYVGNLPWTVTSEELAEVFQKVGSVEMVEV
jgi:RNA recognition motif-containing protein